MTKKKKKKSGNVWHWEGHQQQHVCVHVRVCVWGLSWEKWIADDAAGGKSSSLLPNKSPQTTTCLCSAGKTDATGQWQHCFGNPNSVNFSLIGLICDIISYGPVSAGLIQLQLHRSADPDTAHYFRLFKKILRFFDFSQDELIYCSPHSQ